MISRCIGAVYLLNSSGLSAIASYGVKACISIMNALMLERDNFKASNSTLCMAVRFSKAILPSVCVGLVSIQFFVFKSYTGSLMKLGFAAVMTMDKIVGLYLERKSTSSYLLVKVSLVLSYSLCIFLANMFGSFLLANMAVVIDICIALSHPIRGLFAVREDGSQQKLLESEEHKNDPKIPDPNVVREDGSQQKLLESEEHKNDPKIPDPNVVREENSQQKILVPGEPALVDATMLKPVYFDIAQVGTMKDGIVGTKNILNDTRRGFNTKCVHEFKKVSNDLLGLKRKADPSCVLDLDAFIEEKTLEMRRLIDSVKQEYKEASSGLRNALKCIDSSVSNLVDGKCSFDMKEYNDMNNAMIEANSSMFNIDKIVVDGRAIISDMLAEMVKYKTEIVD